MKPKYNHRPYNNSAQSEEKKVNVNEDVIKNEVPVNEEIPEESEDTLNDEPVEKDLPKKEERDIPQIAAIVVDLCNIRKSPSPTADILGTAVMNAEFKVDKLRTGKGYVAINFGDILGFIREDLVRVFDNPAYVAHDVRKF